MATLGEFYVLKANAGRLKRRMEANDSYHKITCSDASFIFSHVHGRTTNNNLYRIYLRNIGMRLPNAQKMYSELQANILMVEYRGYGDSDSVKPTEVGLRLDAEAALDFIRGRSEIDPDSIFCFGRSLGGAVAFHLAQYSEQNKQKNGRTLLAGLIVENTFLSIAKMVDSILPWVAPLKFLVLKIGWDSEIIAPRISLPVLYLAGDTDELVPFFHMKELYRLSSKSSVYSKMHTIRGGMHNNSWVVGGKEYYTQMRMFLSHVVSENGGIRRRLSSDWSEVSVDDKVSQEESSIVIGMGEAEKPNGISSIPIMPTNLVSIAKATASRRSTAKESDKKQK